MFETVREREQARFTAHTLALAAEGQLGELLVDYLQVAQVLHNLIENAAKYSPPGSTITISARCEGPWVAVSVSDQGPGVDEDECVAIFDRFRRGRRAAGVPGSGLGLAIARGLTEANGGAISVGRAPAGGACFTVQFPSVRA